MWERFTEYWRYARVGAMGLFLIISIALLFKSCKGHAHLIDLEPSIRAHEQLDRWEREERNREVFDRWEEGEREFTKEERECIAEYTKRS